MHAQEFGEDTQNSHIFRFYSLFTLMPTPYRVPSCALVCTSAVPPMTISTFISFFRHLHEREHLRGTTKTEISLNDRFMFAFFCARRTPAHRASAVTCNVHKYVRSSG